MIFSLCFGLVLKKIETWKTKQNKLQSCSRWMLWEIGLIFVIEVITFLTADGSSASASWSSSSPDMAFSFPLQRPIFCPAKKSPELDLGKQPVISWLKEQREQLRNLLRNVSEPRASERGWSPCPYSAGVREATQYPELELMLNLPLALCVSDSQVEKWETQR